jgi:Carboxypeptidase regulatory-like domain
VRLPRLLLLGFCIVLAAAGSARAQTATIIGTVTDQTKAVLPGATITATNLETGVPTSAMSGPAGEYRLQQLPPGKYRLQAELAGFSSVTVAEVELLVGQNATVPFALSVAQLNETLTVTGESPFVDTSSSQVAGNVDRRQMESLPLQGRNWIELSNMVKGMTANNIVNTPGVTDDMFQLNLDGQQITQKIAGSGFGQPRFSRESIAEFQIVTNLFDITQGRSAGVQVQAISKSGTNTNSGSFYGFFRDDKLNAADKVANRVLPYSNQQIGGTFGGPMVRDRMHYFASYEYEREPGTFFSSPSTLPGQSFTVPYKNGQKSFLARVDNQLTSAQRLSIRGSRWDWSNPFVLGVNGHPSNASVQTKAATNILGTWSYAGAGSNKIHQLKLGYNNFDWTNAPLPEMVGYPQYDFTGLTIGAPYNFPQHPRQNNWESRYDLTWNKGAHDMKIGVEYVHVQHSGDWYIQSIGRYTMSTVPSNLGTLIPASAATDPSQWNIAALNPIASRLDKNYSYTGWEDIIDSPRPTYAVWFGDTWRVSNQLTINYGIRYDADPNMAAAPNVKENSILVETGIPSEYGEYRPGVVDYGYKRNIRDWRNLAPRAGFTYNVGGRNDFVIRGGSGLYYASPVSNVTFSPGVYSNLITATFPNDGRPDFITNPTNGIPDDAFLNGTVPLPAQSPRVIVEGFRAPHTWQSSIGFQKQLNAATGIEADLTHYDEYNDTRSIDANLRYDPATGYNALVSGGRPNRAYGQLLAFTSDGHKDQTQISTALTRRLRAGFQAGITYTLMLAMHDDGTLGYTNPSANNPFDYLDGELATSTDFQRNTVRIWALYQLPWGFSTAASYFYGSGNRFAAIISGTPYGKTGNNRLNLSNTGGPTNAIVVPQEMLDRWEGPDVIASGAVIPRNALKGLPLHKVDLRLTKDIRIVGTLRAQLIGEVFNLFNRANYGSYNLTLSATGAAQTALFGQPAQNTGNAYVPRQAQLGFRLAF